MVVTRLALAFAILGSCAPRASAQESGPSIAFGGDVMFEALFVTQLRRRMREIGRARTYEEVFSDLAPTLRAADFAIVNLEVPISPQYREPDPNGNAPLFFAPEHLLDGLRAAGVDAVGLANNHMYDQGVRGLGATLSAVQRRGLVGIGAGTDEASAGRARIVTIGRARVALCAWTEGSNRQPGEDEDPQPRIAFVHHRTHEASIREARGHADLVIATFHWVVEHTPQPNVHMIRAAHEAAEAGADVVIGHGPHVPGRTEVFETSDGRRVRIVYSLGNLLATMSVPSGELSSPTVGVRDAPIAVVRTRWNAGRLAVSDVELRHHWIAPPGNAPWMEGGRIAVSRPLSIDAELARLARAGCGLSCTQRAAAYRRRAAIVRDAMRMLGGAPMPREDLAPRELPPQLEAYRDGMRIAVEFEPGSMRERSVDAAQLRRIAELMRDDRTLRAEVIALAAENDETPLGSLSLLRARRVKGLIAMLGPSRSRFALRRGTETGVFVRLFR